MATKTEIDPGSGGGSPRKDVLKLHRLRWSARSIAQANEATIWNALTEIRRNRVVPAKETAA